MLISTALVIGYVLIAVLVTFGLYTYTICTQSKREANDLFPAWFTIGMFWPVAFPVTLIIYVIYYLIKWSRIEVLADKLAEKCYEYKRTYVANAPKATLKNITLHYCCAYAQRSSLSPINFFWNLSHDIPRWVRGVR